MAWRARSHYLTRNPAFLLKTSLIILATGLGIALSIVAIGGSERPGHDQKQLEKLLHPGFGKASRICRAARSHSRESSPAGCAAPACMSRTLRRLTPPSPVRLLSSAAMKSHHC